MNYIHDNSKMIDNVKNVDDNLNVNFNSYI